MKKIVILVCLLVLALGVAGFSAPAQAAETGTHVHETPPAPDKAWGETFKDIWTRDKLTGDWGGLRTDLADHGFYPNVRLSQFYQGVSSGGREQVGRYGGLVDWRADADAEKLFGLWKGLSLSLHAQTRFGKDIGAEAGAFGLPNTPLLYPLPGDFAGTNVTGLLLMQSLFDGRAVAFGGKINTVDLWTLIYPDVGYGQEGFWGLNSLAAGLPWFRFVPLSMWGGGVWTVKSEGLEAGFFAFGAENVTDTWHGWNDSFNDGVGLMGFYRFFYDLGHKPGSVALFAGGSTKKYPSLDEASFVVVPGEGLVDTESKHPWDVALYLHQVFWQADGNPKRQAHVFMGGTVADDNPSFSNLSLFMNIEAFGLFASRPHDRMGIAGFWNRLSSDLVDLVNDVPTLHLRQNLYGFEAYYNIALNPWLHLSPDIQLYRNGIKKDSIAIIPGVRLVMDF